MSQRHNSYGLVIDVRKRLVPKIPKYENVLMCSRIII